MNPEVKRLSALGADAYRAKETTKAIVYIQRALDIEPEHALLWALLGDMYAEQEQFSAAIDAFDHAIQLDPDLASARSALGRSLMEMGQYEKAVETLKESIRRNATSDRYVLLAVAQEAIERREDAISSLETAIRLDPTNDEALYNLGSVVSWHDPQRAKDLFLKVLAVDPQSSVARRELGLILDREGDREEAEKAYRESLEMDSEDAWAHMYLGKLLLSGGRLEEAKSEFMLAAKSSPLWSQPLCCLGDLHLSDGEYSKAVAVFQQVVQLFPMEPDGAYGLGRCFHTLGRIEEAREWLVKSLELEQDPTRIEEIKELLDGEWS